MFLKLLNKAWMNLRRGDLNNFILCAYHGFMDMFIRPVFDKSWFSKQEDHVMLNLFPKGYKGKYLEFGANDPIVGSDLPTVKTVGFLLPR